MLGPLLGIRQCGLAPTSVHSGWMWICKVYVPSCRQSRFKWDHGLESCLTTEVHYIPAPYYLTRGHAPLPPCTQNILKDIRERERGWGHFSLQWCHHLITWCPSLIIGVELINHSPNKCGECAITFLYVTLCSFKDSSVEWLCWEINQVNLLMQSESLPGWANDLEASLDSGSYRIASCVLPFTSHLIPGKSVNFYGSPFLIS